MLGDVPFPFDFSRVHCRILIPGDLGEVNGAEAGRGGGGEAGGGGHAHLMAVFLATHDGYLGLGTQGSQGSAQAASVQAEGLSPLNLPPRSPQASAP